MLRSFPADLHMHTCLSACAELDMTPRRVVERSGERGLKIIAITDHNSSENVDATAKAAEGTGVTVLGGIEVTSSEEVHILALFDDGENLRRMQEKVFGSLSPGENDERLYGHQVLVNEHDEVMGFNRRLLIGATGMNARAVVNLIGSLGGLSVASHIDREAFGILSQLGFIPEDLRFDALEISPLTERVKAEERFRELARFPWVSFSDAHHVKDIGKRVTTFTVEEPTLAEIRLALQGRDGRNFEWS